MSGASIRIKCDGVCGAEQNVCIDPATPERIAEFMAKDWSACPCRGTVHVTVTEHEA